MDLSMGNGKMRGGVYEWVSLLLDYAVAVISAAFATRSPTGPFCVQLVSSCAHRGERLAVILSW